MAKMKELVQDLFGMNDEKNQKLPEDYDYFGYTYKIEVQDEDDCYKIIHMVLTPKGNQIHFDWSPYTVPTVYDFILWVDLGCPERITNGPLYREDLEAIAKQVGFGSIVEDLKRLA